MVGNCGRTGQVREWAVFFGLRSSVRSALGTSQSDNLERLWRSDTREPERRRAGHHHGRGRKGTAQERACGGAALTRQLCDWTPTRGWPYFTQISLDALSLL